MFLMYRTCSLCCISLFKLNIIFPNQVLKQMHVLCRVSGDAGDLFGVWGCGTEHRLLA